MYCAHNAILFHVTTHITFTTQNETQFPIRMNTSMGLWTPSMRHESVTGKCYLPGKGETGNCNTTHPMINRAMVKMRGNYMPKKGQSPMKWLFSKCRQVSSMKIYKIITRIPVKPCPMLVWPVMWNAYVLISKGNANMCHDTETDSAAHLPIQWVLRAFPLRIKSMKSDSDHIPQPNTNI